jgi:hypothetical protein
MRITVSDIPSNQHEKFIQLMNGYHGISTDNLVWIIVENSPQYKITQYCYLISQGELFVVNQKLRSIRKGYEDLIQYIEEFFRGKSIGNFTDLFFLDAINEAFCGGNWNKVHDSWLIHRPEFLDILAGRKLSQFSEIQYFEIEVDLPDSDLGEFYYFQIDSKKSTIIDFNSTSILWRKKPLSISELKKELGLELRNYQIRSISPDEFISRFFDTVEPAVGSMRN